MACRAPRARLRPRGAFALFLGLAGLWLAGCYNPSLPADKHLSCGGKLNDECPKGYTCMRGECWGAGEMPPADAGRADVPGAGPGGCQGPIQCATKLDTPMRCDPVCQSGCGCQQKCTYGKEAPECRDVLEAPKNFWEECSTTADTCRAGAICLAETNEAVCRAHCYRYCRTDQDCGNDARCIGDIQIGSAMASFKVCSPRIEPCNPTGPARCGMPAARPAPAFGCYILSSKFPDLAVCECAGAKNENDACQFEHDCRPGFECVRVGAEARCRQLCLIGAMGVATGGCRLTQTCTPFVVEGRSSTRHGFCR